jgi:sugar phosphate isomerase/epimerase
MVQISKLPDHFYTAQGAQEFAALLKETGVQASAVVAVYDGESYKDIPTIRKTVGFFPTELVDERIRYTKKCIDFARALNVDIVTFHVGFLPADANNPDYLRMLRATTEVAQYAGEHGVTISLETGQERADELLGFIDKIHGTKVGVNFDMANLVLYGKDESLPALKKLFPKVTSVHVKDGVLPKDPSQLGAEARLGEGKGDVKACLGFLKASHFNGPLVIENYMTRSLHTDPVAELRLAKDYIYKVLGQ